MKHAQNRTILLNFLHYTALYASRPYLSLLVEELGGSELEISLIVSVYSLVQVGTALWVGRWIAQSGTRAPELLGSICFLLGTTVLVLTSNLWLVGIGSLFMGAGHGLILLCGQHNVTGISDEALRTTAVGWLSFFNSVGTVLGPLLGGKLRDLFGARCGFLGAVCFSLTTMIVACVFPRVPSNVVPQTNVHLVVKKSAVLNLLMSGAVFFAADIMSVYLPRYTHQLGLNGVLTGMILSANGLAQMAVRPLMGWLCKRYSIHCLLQKCLLAGGACITMIGASSVFGILLLTATLAGCAVGLANPLTLLTVSSSAKSNERSRVLALRSMVNYGAQALSPTLFGTISASVGLASVLQCGGVILLTLGFMMRFWPEER